MGTLLLIILLVGWIREHRNIASEKARRKMLQLSLKKQDPDKKTSKEERDLFHNLGEISSANTDELKQDVRKMAKDILQNTDDAASYAEKEFSVDDRKLKETIRQKKQDQ